jgi:hypothetical protein
MLVNNNKHLLCMVWELFRPVGPGLLFLELGLELDPVRDPAFFNHITVEFRQFSLEWS